MISGSSMVKAGHFPHLGENFKNWFAAFSISLVLGLLPRPQKKKKKNKSKDMGAIKMFLRAAGGKTKTFKNNCTGRKNRRRWAATKATMFKCRHWENSGKHTWGQLNRTGFPIIIIIIIKYILITSLRNRIMCLDNIIYNIQLIQLKLT